MTIFSSHLPQVEAGQPPAGQAGRKASAGCRILKTYGSSPRRLVDADDIRPLQHSRRALQITDAIQSFAAMNVISGEAKACDPAVSPPGWRVDPVAYLRSDRMRLPGDPDVQQQRDQQQRRNDDGKKLSMPFQF